MATEDTDDIIEGHAGLPPKSRRMIPSDGEYYGWKAFERWANDNGIQDDPDDWVPWWECWKAGYKAGVNQL